MRDLPEAIKRRRLDVLIQTLPKTDWCDRFYRRKRAVELGLKVINTKDTK